MFETICVDHESFLSLWGLGAKKFTGVTPMYTEEVRAFENEIFSSPRFKDESFIVKDIEGAIALVPLYRFENETGEKEFRYGGEFLRGPITLFEPESKRHKEAMEFIFGEIQKRALESGVKKHRVMMESVELLEGRCYYNYFSDFGYSDESTISRVIDLSIDKNRLWLDVRKSYRPLITRALKQFKPDVVTADNFDFGKCEEYRILHKKVAGRQTRSILSFHLMYDMIKANRAFLVLIRSDNNEPVASHFFYCCGRYCLYASSAVATELSPSSGVGHLGFWQGAMTALKLGCRFIDMGQLFLTSNPSEKEINIALFKKGFGGKTVTVFRGVKEF